MSLFDIIKINIILLQIFIKTFFMCKSYIVRGDLYILMYVPQY